MQNFDPLDSKILFGLDVELNDLIKLYNLNRFPKVLLISGKKGIGKFTLILHFLNYIFNKKNYDLKKNKLNNNKDFINSLKQNLFENIFIFKNKKIKIENIRALKNTLLKSTSNNNPRFIILDNIDSFNANSSNALLKILEEPTNTNFFILINNKEKDILPTIKSRCLEKKIFISNAERVKIIKSLINEFRSDIKLDYLNSNITPGNFVHFNQICINNDLDMRQNYKDILPKILKLYKKTKDLSFINLSFFITEQYFYKLIKINNSNLNLLNNVKIEIIKNINDYVNFNINIDTTINSISKKFNYVN